MNTYSIKNVNIYILLFYGTENSFCPIETSTETRTDSEPVGELKQKFVVSGSTHLASVTLNLEFMCSLALLWNYCISSNIAILAKRLKYQSNLWPSHCSCYLCTKSRESTRSPANPDSPEERKKYMKLRKWLSIMGGALKIVHSPVTRLLTKNQKKEQFHFWTRMHSSRMRTGRSLTVCCSLLPTGRGVCVCSGEVCSRGGVCSWGWVSAPGGGCLLLGVGVCTWGWVSAPGGGCLLWAVCSRGGVCSQGRGCLLLGGVVCSRGVYPSMYWGRHPPPCGQNSWHTLVKILPWPNFVAAGKYCDWVAFRMQFNFHSKATLMKGHSCEWYLLQAVTLTTGNYNEGPVSQNFLSKAWVENFSQTTIINGLQTSQDWVLFLKGVTLYFLWCIINIKFFIRMKKLILLISPKNVNL